MGRVGVDPRVQISATAVLFLGGGRCPEANVRGTLGSVVEWLACWTQAQKGLGSNRKLFTPIMPLSVHEAAKFVAALLMLAVVTAGLAESKGSLPPGL